MSAEWIKMQTDLSEDPIVIAIAAKLGIDEFSVVGRLHRLWSWADRHLADGLALGVTAEWIDQFVHCNGFSNALIEAGWLSRFEKGALLDSSRNLLDFGADTLLDSSRILLESFLDSSRNLLDSRVGGGLGGVVFPRFFKHLQGKTNPTTKTKTNPTRAREIEKNRESLLDFEIEKEIEKAPSRIEKQIEKDEAFSIFWKRYPRKDSKVAAQKAYAKLAPNAALQETLLSALDRSCKTEQWMRDGGKYIPFASTWLNQRRWEDAGIAMNGVEMELPSLQAQVRNSRGELIDNPFA
jgi:hypothetical protein